MHRGVLGEQGLGARQEGGHEGHGVGGESLDALPVLGEDLDERRRVHQLPQVGLGDHAIDDGPAGGVAPKGRRDEVLVARQPGGQRPRQGLRQQRPGIGGAYEGMASGGFPIARIRPASPYLEPTAWWPGT
jgi:hypothetical protein